MMAEEENPRVAILESAIEELQSRVEFQSHTIESLDRVVAEQDRRLAVQEKQLLILAQRFKGMEGRIEQSQGVPVDDRPPHY